MANKIRGDLLLFSSHKPDSFLIRFPKLNHTEKGIYCEGFPHGFFNLDGYYQFGKAIYMVYLYNIKIMTIEHETAALCKLYSIAYAWHTKYTPNYSICC